VRMQCQSSTRKVRDYRYLPSIGHSLVKLFTRLFAYFAESTKFLLRVMYVIIGSLRWNGLVGVGTLHRSAMSGAPASRITWRPRFQIFRISRPPVASRRKTAAQPGESRGV